MASPEPVAASSSDAALIAAWQAGDEQAAAELVRRHARALARFLAGGGAREADVDDLVQETFIRAFRAVGREAADRLRAGLARLPRMQREVFLLRAQQGLAYEEIAAALDTSTGAARVHYHHAVRRLKGWLE